eukprot:TRINITY_DN47356_c0_g1_i1.p1 TRINITY_DN47356_c0_g1~~TRINITY_DN47356_c0_g1_i1.p1  ORF type:complete len:436 (+),score=107.86 TRINITY_DN47356_c0_g1_i1:145-1308(+)
MAAGGMAWAKGSLRNAAAAVPRPNGILTALRGGGHPQAAAGGDDRDAPPARSCMRSDPEMPGYLLPSICMRPTLDAAHLFRVGDVVRLAEAADGLPPGTCVAIATPPSDGFVTVSALDGGTVHVALSTVRHAPLHWRAVGWGPAGCSVRRHPDEAAEITGMRMDADVIETIRQEGGWMQLLTAEVSWVPRGGAGVWTPLYRAGSRVRVVRDIVFDNGRRVAAGDEGVVTGAAPAAEEAVCEVRVSGVKWDAKAFQIEPIHGAAAPNAGRLPAGPAGAAGPAPPPSHNPQTPLDQSPGTEADSCGTKTYGSVTAIPSCEDVTDVFAQTETVGDEGLSDTGDRTSPRVAATSTAPVATTTTTDTSECLRGVATENHGGADLSTAEETGS